MELFDRDEVLDRVGGDGELLAELVVLLAEECAQLVPAVREAVGVGDAKTLEQSAHKLKGSVAQMAAGPAYATARELERKGREGELAGAVEEAERLEREILELLGALRAFVAAEGGVG